MYKSVSELIGNTPLVELSNYEKNHNLNATIIGKVELFNPAGSIKDRIAKAMIDQAEADGKIDADTVFIEPTSGNTGIGLAAIAAARGNRIIITMPETMSVERRNLMKAYGAELVLTDGAKGMKGAIARAAELAEEIPNSFIPSQFTNPANPAVHGNYWSRNLGGNRGQSGHPGCWCRYWRNGFRYGRISEETEPRGQGCCRGACWIPCSFRRPSGRSQDSGYRRGICS